MLPCQLVFYIFVCWPMWQWVQISKLEAHLTHTNQASPFLQKDARTCSLFTNNSLSLTISLISSPPHLEGRGKSGGMAGAGAIHPQSWCSVQCTGIYAWEIMSNRASCKQASSTTMMIVTADGEADYGMPNTCLYSGVISDAGSCHFTVRNIT